MVRLTIAAAARHCGVARRTLQRAIQAGRLTLTPDHQLTLEALTQAGYVAATSPQGPTAAVPLRRSAETPHVTPQEQESTSQAVISDVTQVLSQALAPLLDRLDKMIEILEPLCHTLARQSTAATPQRQDAATPPEPVLTQIRHWQEEGMSLRAIAAKLRGCPETNV